MPDQKLHRIVFQPSGRQGYVPDGITVLDAARQLGVGIEGICGGRQTCDDILATGICGSGIISADGRFGEREHPLIHFNGRKGVYTLAPATQSATGSPIVVTQDDVRAIQLAKAALYAGVTLLLDHHGSRAVERILLAGAFGSYIDPKYAMILGLIPDCGLSRVMSVGNAAGDGADRPVAPEAAPRSRRHCPAYPLRRNSHRSGLPGRICRSDPHSAHERPFPAPVRHLARLGGTEIDAPPGARRVSRP